MAMDWENLKKSEAFRFFSRKKKHFLFPVFTLILGVPIGMLTGTPMIGAACTLIALGLFLVILFYPNENEIVGLKSNKLRVYVAYTVSLLVCLFVWIFCWENLVAIFSPDEFSNVYVKAILRENTILSLSDPNNQYTLLVEFGAYQNEVPHVDLEVNTGNPYIRGVDFWWDESNQTEKRASAKPLFAPAPYESFRSASPVTTRLKSFSDMETPPIFELQFSSPPILPQIQSLYLFFHSDKELELKEAKFNGKQLKVNSQPF